MTSDSFLLDVFICKLFYDKQISKNRKSEQNDRSLSNQTSISSKLIEREFLQKNDSSDNLLFSSQVVQCDSNFEISQKDILFCIRKIPWATPELIEKRWKEIKAEHVSWIRQPTIMNKYYYQPKKQTASMYLNCMNNSNNKNDEPIQESLEPESISGSGPKIIIHVCDEAKSLKQDFECPKNLLVQEMKYFTDYLSPDQQTWEDVDISVHCDVTIFHWLMKFAKRHLSGHDPVDELETNNVISILISSDFLKMDALVDHCIQFCHQNMSSILATPCNMNCLSDHLVRRIAEKFSHCQADDVKDKKDKFKSTLFQKKIQLLLEQDSSHGLFRCSHCSQILTSTNHRFIPCVISRSCIGPFGDIVYSHEIEVSFDLTTCLSETKLRLGSWQSLFWYLWGTIYYLWCSRCKQYFLCNQLGHCAYHASQVKYDSALEEQQSNKKLSSNSLGVYPCCGVKTLRFDPFNFPSGCKFRDHVISHPPDDVLPEAFESIQKVLLTKRELVCQTMNNSPLPPVMPDLSTLDIFANEVLLLPTMVHLHQRVLDLTTKLQSSSNNPAGGTSFKKGADSVTHTESDSSSDETDGYDTGDVDSTPSNSKQTSAHKKHKLRKVVQRRKVHEKPLTNADDIWNMSSFGLKKSKRWDSNKSLRANQDAQRNEDHRRMEQMVLCIEQLRDGAALNSSSAAKALNKPKEYAGGIFAKLEHQWKLSYGNMSGQKIPPMQTTRPIELQRARTAGSYRTPNLTVADRRSSRLQLHSGNSGFKGAAPFI